MAKTKGPAEKVEARSVLQAVLLADSFTQRFRPITVERPKVLLPLVNVPMIEYTLEWLATNKVQEVFVFCCAHADQIKQYLANSKWAKSRDMTVQTIVSTSCLSFGEALRLIDDKDVIQNDFVLVSGDTVANVNLGPILEAHRQRRAVDKQAIFTMVLKSTQHPHQRVRMGDPETIVCIDPTTQRLLKFYEPETVSRRPATLKLDAAFFSERDNVQVRTDLMDTHISICAPEVLMLFTDNFDFANLKRDFIPGVLSEEELGSKLYIHEVGQSEYAAHIHNLRSYDAVSRDIIQRWVFPMVPDTNILWKSGTWGATSYRYARGQRYYEQQVSIARNAHMGEDICIGAGTSIGEQSTVVQSVIGRNCRIGKNVIISGCYVQDNVAIQDNVVMHQAMVCENAVIQQAATLQPGTLISYGVVIAAKHTVPSNARISLCRQLHQAASLSDDELEYVAERTSKPSTPVHPSRGGGNTNTLAPRRPVDDDEDEDEELEDDDDSDQYSEDSMGQSLEKPTETAIKIAESIARGQSVADQDASSLSFDTSVVGPGGAGYSWVLTDTTDLSRQLLTPPDMLSGLTLTEEDEREAEEVVAAVTVTADESSRVEEPMAAPTDITFKTEISETFLRCIKLRTDHNNALIELNSLKIAEDRTFADVSKYLFTTLLAMCGPAPAWVASEYLSLFKPKGSEGPTGIALLKEFLAKLKAYKHFLKRFLRTSDDQVEMLLAFEDYCSGEDVYSNQEEHGKAFTAVFGKVLQLLYDADILSEEGIEAWAEAKAEDAEEDQEFLRRASDFLEWLRNASEEEDEDEEDDD